MIRTIEIAKERWQPFLDWLDRQLADRPVRLEVIGRTLGDQEMANQQPFRGLEYDPKGSERGSLVITVGSDGGELSHRIGRPTKVYVGLSEAGLMKWIAIEEGQEVKTLIHFQELPELPAEAAPPA